MTDEQRPCDAIVVGGGFAGLAAATSLSARGYRVLVLEARPTLGGRATAFTDPATGERVDNGQHVLFGCYHDTFAMLRRVGTETLVALQPSLEIDVVERSGRLSRLACPRLPPPLHLLAGVLRWPALDWRDRAAVMRLAPVAVSRRAPGPGVAAMTVREWLERRGQTARLVELLWEPLAVSALNQPIDVAAAAPFVTVLSRLFGRQTRDAALGLPSVPLDELYAEPARRYIEAHGGVVTTGAPARLMVTPSTAVRGTAGGVEVHVQGRTLRAPAVVCAVPWHALGATFPERPPALAATLDAAERTEAWPIVTVNLWLDRAVTRGRFVGLPGRRMQWVFDKRELFGEASSHLSLVSSGAAELVARSNQELVALAVSELREALPGMRGAAVRRAVVVREKRATFSVAPGQPARPATATAVPGLWLAGDWIETGLPATIESAAASGHRAAEAVMAASPPISQA